MSKRGVLIILMIFLVLIVSVSADKVDRKVEEELEDKEKVSIIVILNDEVTKERFPASSGDKGNDLIESKIESRKAMVNRQQDKALSELGLREVEMEKKELSESVGRDFKLKHSYSVINGFSGNVTRKGLEKLRNNPNVAKIYYDNVKYIGLSSSVPQINADDVWPLVPNGLNLTGQNQTVCVIDTGVDYTHVNLGNCSTANFTNGMCGKVISGWDYVNSDNDPADDHGHGTHVAGIIVSNHTTYKGVAPDAKVVALKACDSSGSCPDSSIVSGIDWCIANKTRFNISIITMSLGRGCYNSTCDDIEDIVVNAANDAASNGIFVDASAGNNNAGGNCAASPACGSNVTAVGGIQDDDTTIQYNRAPFMNILAPSETITSTLLGGGFTSLSGTSMAAPHVAGVAALMLQFNSSLSPLGVRKIMNNTGKAIADSGVTYKRVDALAAIQAMDGVAPVWFNNATNNTAPKNNDIVQFNITCNDTIGLSFYIFSWNDTGIWVNITNGSLNGISQSISVNQTVTATAGRKVYWKFYCNDTNNNWNMTDEWSFSVTGPPNRPTLNSPGNNTIIRANYTLLNWTITDNEDNSMNCYVYGGNQTNATSLINVTRGIPNGTASVYNWSRLNETTYYWKVQCDDNAYNSSNSSIYQFTVAIPPATYPSITSVADYDLDGNIEINWSNDGNESSETYRIYRSTSNITLIDGSLVNITSGISEEAQFFEDNTTAHGATYWYALVTVDAAGNYNDSVFSISVNGTANDTIRPKMASNVNVTGSGATATLRWYNTSNDVNGNPDFKGLQYVVYYGTNFNSSKALANESVTGYSTTTVSANSTTISVTSSGAYHFVVTTIDDGGNKNLTLDYSNNYGNASLTYTPPSTSSGGGGGGSSGGGGGGGGGGVSSITNLDIKPTFSTVGYAAKQTQGDTATFTVIGTTYTAEVTKLKEDFITISVADASSVFKPGESKEFDVDNDGIRDISVTLSKITGGRAEVIYKMLIRPKEEEKAEEKGPEIIEGAEEDMPIEQLSEEKRIGAVWFLFIGIAMLAFLVFSYVIMHKRWRLFK